MVGKDMALLRGFSVKKLSRKAAQIRPPAYGSEAKWVPFSLFDEASLLRVIHAASDRRSVSELFVEAWKARELGWVQDDESPEVVE